MYFIASSFSGWSPMGRTGNDEKDSPAQKGGSASSSTRRMVGVDYHTRVEQLRVDQHGLATGTAARGETHRAGSRRPPAAAAVPRAPPRRTSQRTARGATSPGSSSRTNAR